MFTSLRFLDNLTWRWDGMFLTLLTLTALLSLISPCTSRVSISFLTNFESFECQGAHFLRPVPRTHLWMCTLGHQFKDARMALRLTILCASHLVRAQARKEAKVIHSWPKIGKNKSSSIKLYTTKPNQSHQDLETCNTLGFFFPAPLQNQQLFSFLCPSVFQNVQRKQNTQVYHGTQRSCETRHEGFKKFMSSIFPKVQTIFFPQKCLLFVRQLFTNVHKFTPIAAQLISSYWVNTVLQLTFSPNHVSSRWVHVKICFLLSFYGSVIVWL